MRLRIVFHILRTSTSKFRSIHIQQFILRPLDQRVNQIYLLLDIVFLSVANTRFASLIYVMLESEHIAPSEISPLTNHQALSLAPSTKARDMVPPSISVNIKGPLKRVSKWFSFQHGCKKVVKSVY